MGAEGVGALGHGSCGFVHPPLAQRGSMACAVFQHCQCREIGTSRAMTAGGTGLCLLLNEVNMKRSKQWSQGYSSNEVSSGKGEIQLCSLGGRGVTAQLQKHLGQRSR